MCLYVVNMHLSPVKKQYSAEDVANCLISIADLQSLGWDPENQEQIKEGVSNLKLQKLLFFAQAAHLALFKTPLFQEEIEAWSLGPVIPTIYQKYKGYARTPITEFETTEACKDPELMSFLQNIWNLFGKYSSSQLVNLSHADGAPWSQMYTPEAESNVIPKEAIMKYYQDFFRLSTHGND